jgi:hypothetical protein
VKAKCPVWHPKMRHCPRELSRVTNKKWLQCAGDILRVASKIRVGVLEKCPRWQTKDCVCVQTKCRGLYPKIGVSVVDKCPGWQPKNDDVVQATCRGYHPNRESVSSRRVKGCIQKTAPAGSRSVQDGSQKIVSVCRPVLEACT